MDFKQVKELGQLPEQELTAMLVKLYHQIDEAHYEFKGFSPFSWKNLEMTAEGNLRIVGITEKPLTDKIKEQNYHDYAAIIYCICAKRKSDEFMTWDADRKIKPVVLREIVLTLCGRNHSIEPLLRKLNKPYINDETFLKGYSTVDEKEATEAFQKEQKVKLNQYIGEQEFLREQELRRRRKSQTRFWGLSGSTVATLLAICVFRACYHSGNSTDISFVGAKNNVAPVVPNGSSLPAIQHANMDRNIKRIRLSIDSLTQKIREMSIADSTRERLLNNLLQLGCSSTKILSHNNLSTLRDSIIRDSIALTEIETEINLFSETVKNPDSIP